MKSNGNRGARSYSGSIRRNGKSKRSICSAESGNGAVLPHPALSAISPATRAVPPPRTLLIFTVFGTDKSRENTPVDPEVIKNGCYGRIGACSIS